MTKLKSINTCSIATVPTYFLYYHVFFYVDMTYCLWKALIFFFAGESSEICLYIFCIIYFIYMMVITCQAIPFKATMDKI